MLKQKNIFNQIQKQIKEDKIFFALNDVLKLQGGGGARLY